MATYQISTRKDWDFCTVCMLDKSFEFIYPLNFPRINIFYCILCHQYFAYWQQFWKRKRKHDPKLHKWDSRDIKSLFRYSFVNKFWINNRAKSFCRIFLIPRTMGVMIAVRNVHYLCIVCLFRCKLAIFKKLDKQLKNVLTFLNSYSKYFYLVQKTSAKKSEVLSSLYASNIFIQEDASSAQILKPVQF